MNGKGTALVAALLLLFAAAAAYAQQKVSQKGVPQTRWGIKVFNTQVPGQFPATNGKVIAFHTDEGNIGKDLNGDGKVTGGMYVIQYYVIPTTTLVNTGEEGWYPSVSGDVIAFERWEQNGGIGFEKDLNGDGDTQDRLIAYYDMNTNKAFDTLANGWYPDIQGDCIAFETREANIGFDLNGDWDFQDPVIRYFIISAGTLHNTQAAGVNASVSGDTIAFTTWESWCWNGGGLTEPGVPNPPFLNFDMDLSDYVLRFYSISAQVMSFTPLDCQYPTIDGPNAAFCYNEIDDDGPIDLDSDNDTIDMVLQLYNTNSMVNVNTMFPLTSPPTVDGQQVAFDLEEFYLGYSVAPAQGTELNGNGFPGDHIVCFYDMKLGAFTSTGVAGFCDSGDNLAGGVITFQGQWNGQIGYIILE